MFKKRSWKPIAIDGSLFSGGAEDLIGIEECTDYEIDNVISSKKTKEAKILSSESITPKKNNQKKNIKLKSPEFFPETNVFSPSTCGNTSVDNIRQSEVKSINNDESYSQNDMEIWQKYGLPKQILDALRELHFECPTHIQTLTLPAAVLGRRDILGAAETGSGKTLAFGLPILTGILKIQEKNNKLSPVDRSDFDNDSDESDFEKDPDKYEMGCVKSINDIDLKKNQPKPLYAIILTPTRELAMQVKAQLMDVAKYTGIYVAVVVGGMAAVKQERILAKGPEIVVATPGRLWELIQQGNPHLSQFDSIRFLAIDETDRMLEKGHFQELHEILERINLDEDKKKLRQNFVFSATLTLVHELPNYLKTKKKLKRTKNIGEMTASQKLQRIIEMLGITDPKIVDITEGRGTAETLTECRITCDITEKDYYLFYFLKRHPGRTLIFCNSIGCVKRLSNLLNLLECNPLPLHASMQQRQRLKNLERFRDTENSILVATDVAARGLDIPSVEHVIHYQTPRTSEGYVHRSGRTARASKEGITVLLIEPNELQNYVRICQTLGKSEDIPTFPVEQNYLQAVKERVNLARELDELQLRVKKVNSEVGWFQKAAQDMDIIIDDYVEDFDDHESHSAQKAQKKATIKRKQLASLLARPIFPKGFNTRYPILNQEFQDPFLESTTNEKKALDVMKTALEELSNTKKVRKIALFKPKKRNTDSKFEIKVQKKNVKGGGIVKNKNKKSKLSKKFRRK